MKRVNVNLVTESLVFTDSANSRFFDNFSCFPFIIVLQIQNNSETADLYVGSMYSF